MKDALLEPQSVTQTVYERLRTGLLTGRLSPGQKLKMAELCSQYSTNLSAIREALSRLTSEGLVVATPQRGFRATPLSPEDLRDIIEARVEMETICLRRSILRGGLSWEVNLVAAGYRLFATAPVEIVSEVRLNEAWVEAHSAFHEALCAGCESAWLTRLRGALYVQSERYRRLAMPLSHAERDVNREHRDILDATLARDVDRATAHLASHLRLTAATLLGEMDMATEAAPHKNDLRSR